MILVSLNSPHPAYQKRQKYPGTSMQCKIFCLVLKETLTICRQEEINSKDITKSGEKPQTPQLPNQSSAASPKGAGQMTPSFLPKMLKFSQKRSLNQCNKRKHQNVRYQLREGRRCLHCHLRLWCRVCGRDRESGFIDLVTGRGAAGFLLGLVKLCTASNGY